MNTGRAIATMTLLAGCLGANCKDSEHRLWTRDENLKYQDSVAKQVCETRYLTTTSPTYLCPGPGLGPNGDSYRPPGGDGQP